MIVCFSKPGTFLPVNLVYSQKMWYISEITLCLNKTKCLDKSLYANKSYTISADSYYCPTYSRSCLGFI